MIHTEVYHEISEEFSLDEIHEASRNNRLLSMELELSLRCNFKCPYCYTPTHEILKNEMSIEEIKDVLVQAKELGAKKIILLGGEPTIYPHLFEIIDFINELGMHNEIFTNGSIITSEFATKLYSKKVRVVLKLNSFKPEVMELLTGRKDSYDIAMNALENLKTAGYASSNSDLAVSTIICKQNVDEIIELWEWLKDQNIEPYFEIITPQGDAVSNDWLNVPSEKLKELFTQIAEIDRVKYDTHWKIQPPLVGDQCLRHLYSCLINSQGEVMPCVGINESAGSIRNTPLEKIIKDSEIIQDLRNHLNTIKGPCGSCDQAADCYGCRGAAYQLTGDPLASDPLCWNNLDKQDQIFSLPFPVDDIIPQKKSMKMVEFLTRIGDRVVETELTVQSNNPFLEESGELSETIYMELIAQSMAAANGFKALGQGKDAGVGYLLGARKLTITGVAKIGDKLTIRIYKDTQYGNFGIVQGTVFNDKKIIAKGEIKVYVNSDDTN